jgi:2-keto-myo-inositol isomerase
MTSRRTFLSTVALGTASLLPLPAAANRRALQKTTFRYCLNTSTIRGQSPGLRRYIEIASKTGYDGVELWVRDVQEYLSQGNSAASLKSLIEDHGLTVEGAIGFAPWLKGEDGMDQMKKEMEMMASIGGKRIAAPASGFQQGETLDLQLAGEKFHELLEVGEETGIQPCLEFWGTSPVLSHMAQVLMVAAYANHPGTQILADVYHMFRGGSGFHTLKMIPGDMLELFHMNDYLASIPREKQNDSHRVFPGDGAAPLKEILTDLKNMGGVKVLSLELFNPDYWKRDPEEVAGTGLVKMKEVVARIGS